MTKIETKAQAPVMSLTFHWAPLGSEITEGPVRGMASKILFAVDNT